MRLITKSIREVQLLWDNLRLNEVHTDSRADTHLTTVIHTPSVGSAVLQNNCRVIISSTQLLESKTTGLFCIHHLHLVLEFLIENWH